jgi:hypothetical protein
MQGPSPGELVPIVVPIAGMLTGMVITGLLVIGPIGRAIGKVILHLFGVDRAATLPAGEVADVRALLEEQGGRLDAVQRQVGELAERQDFAERLLAQVRNQPHLPGAKDAAG